MSEERERLETAIKHPGWPTQGISERLYNSASHRSKDPYNTKNIESCALGQAKI